MKRIDTVLRLDNLFVKELPSADDTIDSIYISGYASTNSVDRAGDVIPSSVWEAGMQNYLKNPILLAYHSHRKPAGRMIEHKVDDKGLWIKGRISAASDVFNLVKDEVLTAFSVSFQIKDAEYNSATELFIVKELELLEISVVSIPCNQDTLFSLAKSFESEAEYKEFKKQFTDAGDPAKGLESSSNVSGTTPKKEWNMSPEEIKQMVADAAKAAADAIRKETEDAAAAAKAKAAEDAELDARVKAAVAEIKVGDSGAEKLLAEMQKRFDEQSESVKRLEGLESVIAEKAKELEALQKSKMNFRENKEEGVSYADKEKAVMLAKMAGKQLGDTAFGRQLLEKAGPHVPSATWELEVSLNMENEVRRRLVVAPLLNSISMKTNVMTIPVNPEAGLATWVTNAQFGTSASSGAAQTHQLTEITLNSYKVATKEYMNFEEDEDSLIVLMPIVRNAMIRRAARAVDKAFLLGAGAGADPVKGLATYDTTSAVTPSLATGLTVADLRAMRRDLGALGLDPSEVMFIVSTDAYYNLLEDGDMQTMDKVGAQATLLTGQIGVVANSPVLVSAEFPTTASGTATGTANIGAIAFNTSNFLVGNQRGLRMDTQDLVEDQRKVLVASLRTGMTQITTNLGQGVSTMRWAA